MKTICLIFFINFSLKIGAQTNFRKGELPLLQTKIDSLTITNYLLNEPLDKQYNAKFKVLEFWATWCRPCLKAVPHLNRLQEKFKQENIVFLSVTDESPGKATKVFGKVNFETIVVSDTTKVLHRKLKIDDNGTMGLPRTVLIDNENKIVWYGSPEKLTTKLIEKFLRKEKLY